MNIIHNKVTKKRLFFLDLSEMFLLEVEAFKFHNLNIVFNKSAKEG